MAARGLQAHQTPEAHSMTLNNTGTDAKRAAGSCPLQLHLWHLSAWRTGMPHLCLPDAIHQPSRRQGRHSMLISLAIPPDLRPMMTLAAKCVC